MHRISRLAAALAAGVLTVTLVPGPAHAAPADRSAGWLSRQLTDGAVVFPQYGDYVAYGLTADVAYALAAVGGRDEALTAIRSRLEEDVDTWTGTGENVNGGAAAKAVVAAQVTGADPADFGGADLVSRLESRISDTAPIVGRLEDSTTTDYANTFSQALAVRGLARAGSAEADEALKFLLKQQCSEGYFRLYFTEDKAAQKQSCDAAGDSVPDTDATALSLLSLDALPKSSTTRKVRRAMADATAWLRTAQKKNGSFVENPGGDGLSNSNSTGLAGWALGETGSCGRASKAAAWVKKVTVRGKVAGTPLAGERGAIAFTRDAFEQGQEDGITDGTQWEWRLASANAAPALEYLRCR